MVSKQPSVQRDGTSQCLAQPVELFQFWSIIWEKTPTIWLFGRKILFPLNSYGQCCWGASALRRRYFHVVWPGQLDLLSTWGQVSPPVARWVACVTCVCVRSCFLAGGLQFGIKQTDETEEAHLDVHVALNKVSMRSLVRWDRSSNDRMP